MCPFPFSAAKSPVESFQGLAKVDIDRATSRAVAVTANRCRGVVQQLVDSCNAVLHLGQLLRRLTCHAMVRARGRGPSRRSRRSRVSSSWRRSHRFALLAERRGCRLPRLRDGGNGEGQFDHVGLDEAPARARSDGGLIRIVVVEAKSRHDPVPDLAKCFRRLRDIEFSELPVMPRLVAEVLPAGHPSDYEIGVVVDAHGGRWRFRNSAKHPGAQVVRYPSMIL